MPTDPGASSAVPGRRSRGARSCRRLRGRAATRPLRVASLLLVPSLLAVTAVSGGLDAVRGPSAPRSVRAGATVETGPLRLTVTAARVTPGQLGPARAKAPADHWVVVLVTAEVTGDESYNQVGRHLTIEGVNGIVDREPTILMVDDADFAEYLHPGVPARLAVAWGQDASAAAPAHLDVRLVAAKYQLDTSDLYAWRLVRDAAVVEDVPVVDRRSPA